MNFASLDDKLALTRERMRGLPDKFNGGEIYVAWTGGKDSTTVLWLWKTLLAELNPHEKARALSIDTGVKFPEIVDFRGRLASEWDLELTVVRPEADIERYPVAEDKTACCWDLKIKPLKRAVGELEISALLTGIRADEHPDRAGREWFEKRQEPEHVLVNPILHWTEMDIWAFAMDAGLPYCELYDLGYRSLGCRPCTEKPGQGGDERDGRDRDKEERLGMLHSLGYF